MLLSSSSYHPCLVFEGICGCMLSNACPNWGVGWLCWWRHTMSVVTHYVGDEGRDKTGSRCKLLDGPGTLTYVRAPYQISFRYPVHSPRQPASWYPNGPHITRGPYRWAGALASMHVIYYILLLIGESCSMRTLFATTPHETIPSRLPHSLPRTTFTKQFLHITVDSLTSSK